MDCSRVAWTDPRYPPGVDHVVSVLGSGPEAELLIRTRQELDHRLCELVSALRLATEGEAPRLQPVDLVEVVQEAVDSVRLEIEGWPAVVVSSGQIMADIDPAQLRTAVMNLVRNAIAYSGKAEPVVVSVGRRRNSATIVVHDRGPGPDPSDRELIFEPFVRRSNAPGTPSGSGLGLYLTQRIVAAHGGSVHAGTADGRSAFRVELPLGMNGRQASAS
jgi:signal transduction histidine kinase